MIEIVDNRDRSLKEKNERIELIGIRAADLPPIQPVEPKKKEPNTMTCTGMENAFKWANHFHKEGMKDVVIRPSFNGSGKHTVEFRLQECSESEAIHNMKKETNIVYASDIAIDKLYEFKKNWCKQPRLNDEQANILYNCNCCPFYRDGQPCGVDLAIINLRFQKRIKSSIKYSIVHDDYLSAIRDYHDILARSNTQDVEIFYDTRRGSWTVFYTIIERIEEDS